MEALPFLVSVPGAARFGRQPLGGVAEWSCSGLQSRPRRFDSDPRLHQVFAPSAAELASASSHAFARASKSGRCGRTTQNR
jgi:hypothetical protein